MSDRLKYRVRPGRHRLHPLLFAGVLMVTGSGEGGAATKAKQPKTPAPKSESLPKNWVLIHSSPEFSVHLDETSRRVTRDGLRVWKVWDYKIPKEVDGRPFRSEKVQTDYDCKTHQIREMIWVTYSGPHGHGEVVSAEPLMQDWRKPEPESISELEWQSLCAQSAASPEGSERSALKPPKPPVKPKPIP